MTVETAGYLGPAKVLAGGAAGYVRVAMRDDVVWARMAMAVPYSPQTGDDVLVISQAPPAAFVIGVLQGHGTTTLQVASDLHLEAPHGEVRIFAQKGVHIRSATAIDVEAPRTTFRATRLELLVTTLVQHATDVFTWASGLLQSRSRRQRWIAEEGMLVRAGRAHVKTTDNIHITGKTVHLG